MVPELEFFFRYHQYSDTNSEILTTISKIFDCFWLKILNNKHDALKISRIYLSSSRLLIFDLKSENLTYFYSYIYFFLRK